MSEKLPKLHIPEIGEAKRQEIVDAVYENPFSVREDLSSRELEPSPEELKILESCKFSLDKILKRMGLEAPGFSPERVHFLPANDPVWSEKGDIGMKAFYSDGHLYFSRARKVEVAFCASHELVHALAHHELGVSFSGDESISLRVRHEGMSFFPKSNKGMFAGFNEGAVELLARAVRRVMAKDRSFFNQQERKYLNIMGGYQEQVEFLIACFDELERRNVSLETSFSIIISDELEGSYRFLKMLENAHPGAVKIIAKIGFSPEEARKAALEMGYELNLSKTAQRCEELFKILNVK